MGSPSQQSFGLRPVPRGDRVRQRRTLSQECDAEEVLAQCPGVLAALALVFSLIPPIRRDRSLQMPTPKPRSNISITPCAQTAARVLPLKHLHVGGGITHEATKRVFFLSLGQSLMDAEERGLM